MGILTPGNIIVNSPVNVKLQLPPCHTGFFMLVSQQAEKGVTELAKEYHNEVGLLLYKWGIEECG